MKECGIEGEMWTGGTCRRRTGSEKQHRLASVMNIYP